MSQAVHLHYVREVGHLLFSLKNQERRVLSKNYKKKNKSKSIKSLIQNKRETNDPGHTKSEVISFQIPFKYSYKVGSPDSIRFLDTYSESNTEEFILSQWKEVVIHKWRKYRMFHVFTAILYWVFTIFTILSIIFFQTSILFEFISLGFIGFFIIFEILQVISYSAFKIKRYVLSPL
jgi:hypothetical protein